MVVFQHQLQSQSQPQLLQQSTSGPDSQTKKAPLMPSSSSSSSCSSSTAWFFPIQSSPSSDMWEIPHCASSTSTTSTSTSTHSATPLSSTASSSSSSWLLSPTLSFTSDAQSTPTTSPPPPTTTNTSSSRMAMMMDDQDDHIGDDYGLSFSGLSDPSQLQLMGTTTSSSSGYNSNYNINNDDRFLTMEDEGIIALRDDGETASTNRMMDGNDVREGVQDDDDDDYHDVVEDHDDNDFYHYDENISNNGDDRGLLRDASTLSIPPQPTRAVLGDATNTVRRTMSASQNRNRTTTTGVPRRDNINIRNTNHSSTIVRRSQFY